MTVSHLNVSLEQRGLDILAELRLTGIVPRPCSGSRPCFGSLGLRVKGPPLESPRKRIFGNRRY
jgi:hypothetical protein